MNVPKGFAFFAGLSMVVGAVGFATNGIFMLMTLLHGLAPTMALKTPVFWLSLFHLFVNWGLIYGGFIVKKRDPWGRNLIVTCASISLLELFYNTAIAVITGSLAPSFTTLGFFVLPAVLNGALLYYFLKEGVREYLSANTNSPS